MTSLPHAGARERAQIVAWLRGPAKQKYLQNANQYKADGISDGSIESCMEAALTCFDIANAIENGDHTKEPEQ